MEHRRRSIRLKDFDYSHSGAYFVTICSWSRECLFGDIPDVGARCKVPLINQYGEIVKSEWMKTADIRTNVELDEFIVMPNHVHGIIVLSNDVGARRCLAPFNNEYSTTDADELNRIREYIINNPAKWAEDEDNPVNVDRGIDASQLDTWRVQRHGRIT
jgi:REP element-mobilizing transposase RayT